MALLPEPEQLMNFGFQGGYQRAHRIPDFLSRMCVCSFVLTASLGGRIGEYLPPRPGTDKPLSALQQTKLSKIANLAFFNLGGRKPFQLGSLSYTEQLNVLQDVHISLEVFATIILSRTKNNLAQLILLFHLHVAGSAVVCPLCHLVVYFTHRILVQKAPLLSGAPCFSVYSSNLGRNIQT